MRSPKPLCRTVIVPLAGFICLLLAGAANSALSQTPTHQQEARANSQAQQQPAAIGPSPSQTAIEQPKASVEVQKGENKPTGFWEVKLTDVIQVGINAVLLLVVFWQARINRDQRKTMQDQNTIMQGELDITRESVKQSERALVANETQAKAAEQSVQIAKETFYIGERPYFGITEIEMQIIKNNVLRVTISLQNGGRTPAWHFHVLVWVVLGDTPQSDKRWNLNTHEPRYAYRYFAVGQQHTFIFANPDVRLTEDQIHDLKTGSLRLFIAGTAHYADMRGERLWHNFSALWNPDSATFSDWEG